MPSLSVRLPDQLAARLEELANQTGRTKSYYVLEALNETIDDLEDAYLAQSRLSDFRRGLSDSVNLATVIAAPFIDS
ncbi:MAG: ribbon-helix-helix protein, CopG family [Candidatus Nanopelagicales bacterium]|nr:ribbon-helix-helix protein, CopG family [Candidatus Nanopelagicales bacterium]MCF8551442.1 ribbon-helix-helix protein, CopG family [Candidatus Nanopelagicales bacterium]